MSLPVVLNPLAEADLAVGRARCESRRGGQGADFLLCAEKVFEQIGREPERYGREFGEVRVAPLRRHQYGVTYRLDESQVTVVAVYHLGSDPVTWQSRV